MNMDFLKFIKEQALILIPVLYIIGVFLKNTSKVTDWVIPWIILFSGVSFSVLLLGLNIESVIQGILVSGATVLGNQLIRQTSKKY